LAIRIVAFGGYLRKVSSECQTSVRNGGLVSSLRNLIRDVFVPWCVSACGLEKAK
jgi:hypothetical protein